MTRINVLPAQDLSDNFLLAEVFELPRLWPLIIKAVEKNDQDIPETYRMGKGHVRFFYDKYPFLVARYANLITEAKARNLTILYDDIIDESYGDVLDAINDSPDWAFWLKSYTPTPEAIQLNRDRLELRRRYDGGIYTPP